MPYSKNAESQQSTVILVLLSESRVSTKLYRSYSKNAESQQSYICLIQRMQSLNKVILVLLKECKVSIK